MKPHLPLCLLAALISLNAHILAATPGADTITLNNGTPDPAVADYTLAGDGTQTGAINGSGTLLIESGTVRFSSSVDNANTYSGYTVVNSGAILQFSATDFKDNVLEQLGTSELILSGGTLIFSGSDAWGATPKEIKNGITLKNGAVITSDDGHFTFSGAMNLDLQANESASIKMAWGKNWKLDGVISGAGTLSLQSANNYEWKVFTLSNGGNTFTGTYDIDSEGIDDNISLVLTSANAAGTATIKLSGDATKSWLVLGGIDATVGGLTGAGMIRNGAVTAGSSGTFAAAGAANTLTVNQSNTGTDTYSGTIDSNVNLTKSGAGTLELTNLGTYGGAVKIESGTLALGNVTGMSGMDIGNDGTLRIGNTTDEGFKLDQALSGGGDIVIAGTAAFNAANSGFSGDINIQSGLLKLGATGALGSATITVEGGTLEYSAAGDYANNIVLDAGTNNVQISSTATGSGAVLKGSITGDGNLEKIGAGLLVLDNGGASVGQSFTGEIIVSAGTLQLGQPSGGSTGRTITYGTGAITVSSDAMLTLAFAESTGASNTLTNKIVLDNGANLYLNNGNTVLGGVLQAGTEASDSTTILYKYNHELTLNTALEGAGTINLSESGESSQYSQGGGGLILTQDSTAFSGKIVVGAPTADTSIKRYGLFLRLDSAKAASGADIELKAPTETSGGRIQTTQLLINAAEVEIGGLSGDAGTLVLSGATKNTGDTTVRNLVLSGNGTFSGTIGANLTLTKRGEGTTQTLAGSVLNAGTQMTIESGTLALGTGAGTLGVALLTSNYEVQSGGILLINEANTDANASTATGVVTLKGGQLQFKADMDGSSFGQKITFAANGSSIMGGSSNADHRGWVLSYGASTEADAAHIKVEASVTGSVISAGKIYFQNTNEDGAAIFDLASGTTLELSSILAGADSNAALKITGGGTLIYTGADNGSSQTAVKAIVESGTLQIGNGGTAGDWKNGAIQLGATGAADGTGVTLTFNRSDAMTYGGVIGGKGTINFDGGAGGIYTLQGANTFTGDVNIKQGKVVADHAAAFGTGNTVNLATGATVDYAKSQTDTTSILNAAAGSGILNGANFNGKLNIQANTSSTAVTVTGGLSVAELSFANNSYLSVAGALSSGAITLSEGAHLNGDRLTMKNAGTLEIGKNAAATFTGGIQSNTGSSITLKENGALNVTGNATGGTLTLEKSGTVTVTSGNLTMDKLIIRDAVSQVTVGGALTVNNGGYLYLDTNRQDTPIATATGALTLGGTFQIGFDVNQVTEVAEYTFKLFGANSYSNILTQLVFADEADRSFYYLDTSNFSTDGSVTLVHTDWGNQLVNAADIAAMGGTYTPADGKVLLGSKSEANGGGTRSNPLTFNIGYIPVAQDGVVDYRLTDGEGWLDFQTQMTGDGVGLLIQGNMAFTGNAADHGVIISNVTNNYTGPTRVQNAHVVLDSSSIASGTITAGLIRMLGTGDVTFMGSLAVLELRPGGDYNGDYVFANNLTLRDGATLLQTGGSTTLADNHLTLAGGLGGIIQNATTSKFVIKGGISGTTLTLKGNAAAADGAESIIELAGIKDSSERVLTSLVLQDKINFTLTGANLEAQNLTLTSGQLVVTNQSELRLGAVTGTANGKLKLDGGKLTTVGTGGLITLGGSGAPSFELAGTGNIITVGNTGGLRINNLTGENGFTLGGGNLTLGGGSEASHYQGAIIVDKGTLTLAQGAYITGDITTTSPATGSTLALQINGGSSTTQRTTAGDIRLVAGTTASLTGEHITLGALTLAGNAILGTTAQTAANDVRIESLTIEATGSAVFGNDLRIEGDARIGEGSLNAGSNATILGTTTLSNGTLLLDSGTLSGLSITGTGVVAGLKTSGAAQSLNVTGNAAIGNGRLSSDAITLSDGAAHETRTTLENGSIVAANTLKIDNLTITGTGVVGTSKTAAGSTATIYGSAVIGNGTLSSGQVTVGGAATLQNGILQAAGDIKLGSLSITGTGTVQTDTTDPAKGLNVSGDATIGNGTVRTGTLNIGGNTELQNGSLTALADRSVLQGALTINGKDGKVSFLNSATVKGLVTINDGALTAGNNFSSGEFILNAGKATLGDHALVGSLDIGSGGVFTAGDNASIAAGTGQHIAIGGSATFGKNAVLNVWGDTLDISAGGAVTFGQGSVIQGSLGERGLTFASGSAYAGFLNVGTNNVTFDNGSVYRLDGPVLQQYTGTTVGLTSTGTINIDNGARFVLGENLRNYSIIVAPETMTLVKAGKGGELLVDGQQVKENGNYSYLLENADKYFEWYTFNLIGGNNALELEKIESIHFERVADTDNEITMASIANSLATGARYYDGELKELGASLALTAKGDGHKALSELAQSNASLLSGYMAQTRELRRHNHDLLAQVSLEKTGAERLSYEEYRNTIWANGTGGAYTLDGDDNAPGYKTTQWGGTLGTSRAYGEHFVGGIAFSYMHTDVTVDGHYGDAKGDSYDIDLFAKYNRDNWNITGVITGGLTSLDTTRNLRLDGYDSRTTASGDGSHLLATIQAGYQIMASNDQNSILEPFVMISGGYSSIDSLSEKGAGNAGLTTDSRTQGLCTLGAGVKFTRDYIVDEEDISRGRFDMRVMILQDLKEVNGDLTATYQGMGQKFSLDGASASRMGFLVGLGLSHPLSRQTALFGNVDGEFRKGETGVRANVGLKVTF